jgi:hypothetical protein
MGPAEGYPVSPSPIKGLAGFHNGASAGSGATRGCQKVEKAGFLMSRAVSAPPPNHAAALWLWLRLQLWLRPHLGPNRSPRKLNRRVGYG